MISPRTVNNAVFSKIPKKIRTGDIITIKAIKNVNKDVWQVRFNGKIIEVKTVKSLIQGKIYRGRILKEGNALVFSKIADKNTESVPVQKGVFNIQKEIIAVLHQYNMPVFPKKLEWMVRQLNRQKKPEKLIRLVSHFFDKQLNSNSFGNDIDPIHVFHQYNRSKREGEKNQNRDVRNIITAKEQIKNKIKEQLKISIVENLNGESSSLQLYNHIMSKDDNWIIIPIGMEIEKKIIRGTLRMLIDPVTIKICKLSVALEADEHIFGFAVPNWGNDNTSMKIFGYASGKHALFKKYLKDFSQKLTKLGIELDDTINNSQIFDGFGEIQNKDLKSVNTVI